MDVEDEMFTPSVKPSDAPRHVLRMINVRSCSTLRYSCSNANILAQYSVNVMLQEDAKIPTL